MFSAYRISTSGRSIEPVQPIPRGKRNKCSDQHSDQETLAEQFFDFVDDDLFPCVGAKAAMAQGEIYVHEFGDLTDSSSDSLVLNALESFVRMLDSCDSDSTRVHSLVALFTGPATSSELHFENMLWTRLYNLHILDVERGAPAASDISSNPASPQFSLSLAGHPFFVIGLHPGSSRMARRFQSPVLVFNSHRQFEKLRADGRYAKMQKAIRQRDIALQGSINPNLADFGSNSEARQYSGRKVGPEWKCPFDFQKARKS